ncbi:MAG: hypothetical protein ACXVIJ_02435 [Thermoanaerobaculia bacterium]
MNVTVPVGVPVPVKGWTVAVIVAGSPYTVGLFEVVRETVTARFGAVTVTVPFMKKPPKLAGVL